MDQLDVVVSGLVFHDLVLGLPGPPRPGTEVWATDSAESPGGIANFAVALARLGLRTGLAAVFGADDLGDRLRDRLTTTEGVDLSLSRTLAGWQTPLTVALAYDNDRALVTRGTPPPLSADELITTPPAAHAVAAHIGPWPNEWLAAAKAAGSVVFADVGWDPSERWDPTVLDQLEHCDVFLPNAGEAMNYTRTAGPEQALDRLGELVPVVVVSNGAQGALALDAGTGERVVVPAYQVPAVDTTGAGDVFAAGFIAATLWGLPLAERVRFGSLTAAISVTRLGGADAAPRWADLAAWQHDHPEDPSLAALLGNHGATNAADAAPVQPLGRWSGRR
ncbi:PfkB domain protein [Kribbella flavida DSM 17836]|uniref:PfkB domain protein n=1 Tax=Kribbella flavida (strain DSM 17836 / JCM 10339 / NBRC 14399) TaxID=479435 RepID=D2PZH3_KRIFD|nr:PfkB family carbohydrate kinase [Kribbella flavida]ADB33782.1 PfkB domain protein [Kribbella flavida DSM 17836]